MVVMEERQASRFDTLSSFVFRVAARMCNVLLYVGVVGVK